MNFKFNFKSISKLSLVAILLFFSKASPAANQSLGRYDLQDLKSLAQEKNYREFLRHANDIRPNARSQEWQKMVNEMAVGFTATLRTAVLIAESDFQLLNQITLWPILKTNEFFSNDRGRVGLKYYSKMWQKFNLNKEAIFYDFVNFYKKLPPVALDVSIQMGHLALDKGFLYTKEISIFFEKPFATTFSEFYCKNPINQNFIEYQIQQRNLSFLNKIHDSCWNSIAPQLKQRLSTLEDNKAASRIYHILKTHNLLNQAESDAFLFRFLLNGPVIGHTFNYAWHMLEAVKSNYQRRSKLLSHFKKDPRLPGKIFRFRDNQKKLIVLQKIYDAIPEYYDQYARTCLDYVTSKKVFSKGNPTLECAHLFHLSKGTDWLEPDLRAQFNSLKAKPLLPSQFNYRAPTL